ncbi:MAG: dienelactone hydrolase family protein [Phycisphaeraceae bacterium]|nr:dienelactone hydrolase family protein [Phycisphaeraceae bacterium]
MNQTFRIFRAWSVAFLMACVCVNPAGAESTLAPALGVPTLNAPLLKGIAIDGDASDWADRGLRVDLLTSADNQVKKPEDFDPRIRVAWDERGLLVLAVIRDDVPLEAATTDSLWMFDSLEIFVAEKVGAHRYYQVLVGSGADPKQGGKPRYFFNPRSLVLDRNMTSFGIDLAAKTNAQGVATVEMLLPWSNLGPARQEGEEVGLQIFINDSDDPADRQGAKKFRVVWYPSTASDNNTQLMQPMRLAKEASPPVQTRAQASYAGGRIAVSLVGPVESVGKTAELRNGTKPLASVPLTGGEGRATAGFDLDPAGPDRPYADLNVAVEGLSTQLVFVPPDQLLVQATDAQAQPRLALTEQAKTPEEKVFPGVSVALQAKAGDETKATSQCGLGQTTTLALTSGLYYLDSTCVDPFGRQLANSEMMLVGLTIPQAVAQARAEIGDQGFDDYRGWLNYLGTKAQQEDAQGAGGRQTVGSLLEWARKIKADPKTLAGLRENFEWAYLSKVDGSGQPFMIWVPRDYTPSKAYTLQVYLHGSTGRHDDWIPSHRMMADTIYISPLGRSRTSGWDDLGEVDVLEAIDYVKQHWHIDDDRVHLVGGSMGGGGTYDLIARHPDLFASGRPMAGYGYHVPVENILHVPLYAVHGTDDWMVPISQSRLALRRLTELGGLATMEEFQGAGHAWELDLEAIQRAQEWALAQVRSKSVREVRYTATDESARGAYWVEVVEWGPQPLGASIHAVVGRDSSLHLHLENVTTARFDLASAPVDPLRPLAVVVDRQPISQLPAPLPAELFVTWDEAAAAWKVSTVAPQLPPQRLHFSPGPSALYHGEPVMIVWGTTAAEEATRQAIHDIAQVARQSTRPNWPADHKDDKGWISRTLYGQLPGKADVDVTAEDMQRYNLVLLGTAAQNAVVAKLADQLPVKVAGQKILAEDDVAWDWSGRGLSLVYYNPAVPGRLIHWIASDRLDFYRVESGPFQTFGFWGGVPDLVLTQVEHGQRVACRYFDSRWRWVDQQGYAPAPKLPAELCTTDGQMQATAQAVRQASGADFAVVMPTGDMGQEFWTPGESRCADVGVDLKPQLAVLELTGGELMEAADALQEAKKTGGSACELMPRPEVDQIDPAGRYRLAMLPTAVWSYCQQTRTNPLSLRLSDVPVREVFMKALISAAGAKGEHAATPTVAPPQTPAE